MRGRCGKLLLTTTAWVTLGWQPAFANPLGGQVVGGSATIQGQGTAKVTVTQSTDKAIINWNTFNISAGEKTQFIQPNSSSIALNRVTGGLGPSQLYGTLTANGRIFLVNPDGILVGPGARIDTAGFLATTSDIKNEDFMAGRYNFFVPGRPDASVVNLGAITASSQGFAALVAPGVRNSGTITATLGKISLASGNGFALDLYGDSLIKLAVSDSIAAQVKDVATGQTLRSLISNDGRLSANGGRVELSAVTARQIVDSVINTTGVIEANSIGTQNGKIVLMSQTAATKLAGAPAQTVKVSGLLSAAGQNAGETGGVIEIAGENVVLANARIDASGDVGGGKVLIGGDWGGGRPTMAIANQSAKLEANLIPAATSVSVDAGTIIDASALQIGDGGKVIVWADGSTNFSGTILARGGLLTGNGGFVETSGQTLNINGARVDTSASNGNTGTWLLDPFNLLIDAAAALAIANGLSSSNLIVQTTATGTSGPGSQSVGDGDITVAADISWNSGNSLTLSAYRSIIVNANITNTGGAGVTLRADNTGTGVGTVSFGAGNQIATAGMVSIFYNPGGNDNSSVNAFSYTNPTDFSGKIGGGGMLRAYMLVNTVYDLQNIRNNLTGSYALGRDIDASATAGWNAGAGFVPIGSSSSPFRGVFDGGSGGGQRFSIIGLTINSAARHVGLFGFTESTAIIRKLDLTSASVSSSFDSTLGFGAVGGLVGLNRGSISEVSVTGNISAMAGNISFFKNVGGLVGENLGTITASSSFGTVSGNEFSLIGGLVGRNPGTITNSSSESAVSSPRGPAYVGGLVGFNFGQILDSHASGAVSGTGSFVSATTFTGGVGGLVGSNGQNSGNAAIIRNSYASGEVIGYGTTILHVTLGVGGLVGLNNLTGKIENSHATGRVNGDNSTSISGDVSFQPFTGGLVGFNSGLISDSYAEGSITVVGSVINTGDLGGPLNGSPTGGLVGLNAATGQIVKSYATGSITGSNLVFGGGLVGTNDGTISVAHATGNVTLNAGVHGSSVGGFVGRAAGTIDQAYALGNVNANFIGMAGYAGGFAGRNRGVISESYSMGMVEAQSSNELFIGGFTGKNINTISKSYSMSPVTATGLGTEKFVGGFAGLNTGTLDQVYATGLVQAPAGSITGGLAVGSTTPAGSVVGGLVGSNTLTDFTYSTLGPITQSQITFRVGVITHSYWDKDSTGQPNSDGGSGLSTVEARQQASYTGFAFGSVWAPNDLAFNSGYPYLLTVPPQNPSSPPVLPTGTPTPPPLAPPSNQISYNNTYSYTSVTGQTLTVNYNAAVATVGGHTFVPIGQFDSSLTGNDSWTAVNAMIARGAGEASFAIASSPISTTTIGNHFVLGFINSGNPVIIGGTIIRDGIPETHWMLATAVTSDGKIVANDPWTGGQVIIDPRTGSVVHPPNFPLPSFKMDRFQTVTIR